MSKSARSPFGTIIGLLVAAGVSFMSVAPASAEDFKFGDMTLSLDNTVSLGVGIRTSKQSCTKISPFNGGCAINSSGQTNDVNTDDGDVNFGQWDPYAETLKFVTEAQAKWQNYGAFVRVKGYYDYIGDQVAGTKDTDYGKRPLSDSVRGNDAHNAAAWDLSLLDAFVYGNFDLGELPLNVRFGKQVVNWGESLVIPGGINQFLSVDLSALRTPGSEIKEALLPQEMLYASLGLPDNFDVEAWAGFKWRRTQLDPVGTFYSGADIFGAGGAYLNLIHDGPGTEADQIQIAKSDEPRDLGQFGVKLGYYADWLNDGTELGLYYVHYNSNLPFLEYSNGLPLDIATALGAAGLARDQYYRAAYPENIQLIGTSFSTVIENLLYGTAFSGEAVFQPNLPFQVSSGEMLFAHWLDQLALPASTLPYDRTPGAFPDGFTRTDAITGQLATISTLPTSDWVTKHLNADLVILIANWGFQYLPNVSDSQLSAMAAPMSQFQIANPAFRNVPGLTNGAFGLYHPDSFSHGYRLIANVQYDNAFGTPWTLTPDIQFAQDFGTSAGPIGPGFLDNRKSLSLGVRASYQSAWSAGVQWTATRGNAVQNLFEDRDFMTFDVSYAF
ncbi:MAG TPA: DUF1302 domain-containing protein [Parvibaculum sp.]